jgi:hypothetical protein
MIALRLMIMLVLVLVGAVIGIGFSEDDADLVFLHGQTQSSRPSIPRQAATAAVVRPSSARPSFADPVTASATAIPVLDLVCVLRC